jgi:hypothetical protein
MTTRKVSKKELKLKLIEDAKNPNAWGKPITVPASTAPRPERYSRSGHLQLAAKFYILSLLHFLGADASLTSPQSDNVDITVVKQPGEALTIQVKTLMGTSQWPVEKFSARKHHFVAFIRYERESRDPQVATDVYIWASERLQAFIARDRTKTVSLEDVASKLDPKSAWKQFVGRPAA